MRPQQRVHNNQSFPPNQSNQSLLTKKEFEKMCLVTLIGVITLICNLQIDDLIIGCCVIVQLSVALGLSNSLNLMVGSKDVEWMVLALDEQDGAKIAENLQKELSNVQQQQQPPRTANLQPQQVPNPQPGFFNNLLNTVGVKLLFRFFHRRSVLSCCVIMTIIGMCLSIGGFEALLLFILCIYIALGGASVNGIAQLNSRYTNNIFVVFSSVVLGIFVYFISLGTLGVSFFSKNKIELKKELMLLMKPLQEKLQQKIKEIGFETECNENSSSSSTERKQNEKNDKKMKKEKEKSNFWDMKLMKLFAFGILSFSFCISIVRACDLIFFSHHRIPLSSKSYKYYLLPK